MKITEEIIEQEGKRITPYSKYYIYKREFYRRCTFDEIDFYQIYAPAWLDNQRNLLIGNYLKVTDPEKKKLMLEKYAKKNSGFKKIRKMGYIICFAPSEDGITSYYVSHEEDKEKSIILTVAFKKLHAQKMNCSKAQGIASFLSKREEFDCYVIKHKEEEILEEIFPAQTSRFDLIDLEEKK